MSQSCWVGWSSFGPASQAQIEVAAVDRDGQFKWVQQEVGILGRRIEPVLGVETWVVLFAGSGYRKPCTK